MAFGSPSQRILASALCSALNRRIRVVVDGSVPQTATVAFGAASPAAALGVIAVAHSSFFPLASASFQRHRRGPPHEAAAAGQQHGEQHGRLQHAEASPGEPEPVCPAPKRRPDAAEPEPEHVCQ